MKPQTPALLAGTFQSKLFHALLLPRLQASQTMHIMFTHLEGATSAATSRNCHQTRSLHILSIIAEQ